MNPLHDFLVALTFLTRLGRARITTNEAISRSMPMYPLVGALIGLILALVSQLPLSTWVLAWTLTGLNLYLTRGLHWDGWADLWDGWGSGATGERFWAIVKDSRIGAFGTMGLVIGLGTQTALLEAAVSQNAWGAVLFAPVFGRFCCLVMARLSHRLTRCGLGANAMQGATRYALILGGCTTLLPALTLSPTHLVASLALSVAPLAALLTLGRRHGGVNGDFLGTAIIAGEICALLPLALHG
ncbi:MAG: adenosylcobinamide-GDP ribazoletransferase [Desulfomicrobium sp.]